MKTAAIVGAGAIALGQNNSKQFAMNHFDAYVSNKSEVQLRAFVEPNKNRIKEVSKKFPQLSCYSDIDALFENESIDIVSVCVPAECQEEILSSLLDRKIQGIWCEKPMAIYSKKARYFIEKSKQRQILIQVSYWRRFIPEIQEIKRKLARGEFGKLNSISGYYPETFKNNGSHLIDLINFLVGPINPFYVHVEGLMDVNGDGPVTVLSTIENGLTCILKPIPRRNYNIFELDILTDTTRIRIVENSRRIELYSDCKDDFFPHLRILDPEPKIRLCQWQNSFNACLAGLLEAVKTQNNKYLLSSAKSAKKVVDILEKTEALIEYQTSSD